jgi:hypothetical protein
MTTLNLLLAFVDELVALWGSSLLAGLAVPGRLHWPAMVLAGFLFAGAWGLWAAPRSPRRLQGRGLTIFKAGAFALGTLGLALTAHPGLAWGLALTAVLAVVPVETLLRRLPRRPAGPSARRSSRTGSPPAPPR